MYARTDPSPDYDDPNLENTWADHVLEALARPQQESPVELVGLDATVQMFDTGTVVF